ncbi:hypothetical protein [Leptodesmis sp.]|uniref:hypothetical protein n=1 Tax=Leptodesmis sp. TaxID=3100501 RepID=UPI0040534FEC
MASSAPLTGAELIDCARANGKEGIVAACQRCGYGEDLTAFEQALHQAGDHIGVAINHFEDLLEPPADTRAEGIEVAPDSYNQL